MRFFAVGLACAALVACAACAAPSVRLPAGFVVPSGTRLGGETLYHTLAHSLHTLPRTAALDTLATKPAASEDGFATLLGAAAQQQAVLVAVPEALAPADATGALADNAFPLDEMARTLATGLVAPGASAALQAAFARDTVHALTLPRTLGAAAASRSLAACGVAMSDAVAAGQFTLEGAAFDAADADTVLGAALLLCARPAAPAAQVVVADLRPAHAAAVAKYGAGSAQAAAVAAMTAHVLETLQATTSLFVLATDDAFFADQQRPAADFAVVAPRSVAAAAVRAGAKPDPDTSVTQITIWFTVLMVVVIIVFAFATCGVGLDIEKDTLLYQTPCLRGQPMF